MNAPTDTHSSPASDTDTSSLDAEQTAPPLLRLRLAAPTSVPRRLDGAWWPHSYDVLTEVPRLLAGLPRTWGHIVSVMVNGRVWSTAPGRMLVANQVVRLHRTTAVHAPNTVVLLAPGRGRWDLLVVPPELTEETAEPIMAAAVANLL
ncbi:DUF5994 family protein [Streptomyces sp. NPDC051642]|uniref:DUF5994 family protein n=1 Tax=Streptomyces sp. NPDC051642 TaxID=3154646 RepID=UPI003448F2F6